MSKTGTISYILTILIFLLAFRGILGGIIMNAYLAIGVFLTFGVLMLSFGYVTIISALFGSILIGMGIDYGVYVFSRWREEATHQDDKISALKKSIKEVIPPTFEAAITTSAGFLCIYISQIKGAKILALVSACRILIYLLLSRIFLPAIMKYFSKYLTRKK
jgi:uncharacterized protein